MDQVGIVIFQINRNKFQDRVNSGNNAEIAWKLCENFQLKIRESSIKFHFKVRKPRFKPRKALFKRGLERNGKNKNVLEFQGKKDGRVFC